MAAIRSQVADERKPSENTAPPSETKISLQGPSSHSSNTNSNHLHGWGNIINTNQIFNYNIGFGSWSAISLATFAAVVFALVLHSVGDSANRGARLNDPNAQVSLGCLFATLAKLNGSPLLGQTAERTGISNKKHQPILFTSSQTSYLLRQTELHQ